MRLLDNILILFFSLKDELLEAENHPEWFLRLKNLTKKNIFME